MESLRNKAITGVGWSLAENLVTSGVTFLVGVILARLLSPDEFGIIGMITIFIAISNSLIDSGFSTALIRKTDAQSIDYNTVFYFNLISGAILSILLFVSAPYIGIFFNEPSLVLVTRVMSSSVLISSFGIIQYTLLMKKLDFKSQTKISFIASFTSAIVGILMAVEGLGIWSLVGLQLSRQCVNTCLLWLYCKWYPSIVFSKKSFIELFNFGSKLLISGLIDTIYKNIFYVVIGKYYNAAQLGQYTRAEQFNTLFSINLTNIIQRVSFPVLSSIQNESERMKNVYCYVIKITMLITFACMFGLAAVAKPLIILLIGEKWLTAAGYLQIICFAGMLYPLNAINLNILQVKGRSDIFLKLEIIKKFLAIIPIIAGIMYNIEYLLWGSVVITYISYFLNSYYSEKMIGYSTVNQIKDILPAFLISFVVAFIMWGISFLHMKNIYILLIQCLIGISLAICIYEKIKLKEYIEIKKLIITIVKRNKNGI